MLISEGGEKANLIIFNNPVHAMNKTTFYFIIAILVFVDMVQSKYQKNISKIKLKFHLNIKQNCSKNNLYLL